MSRRDTIIIAVLINACLLIILFATAITKKEDMPYTSQKKTSTLPQPANVNIQDVQRTIVQNSSYSKTNTKLEKPSMPAQVPDFKSTQVAVVEPPKKSPKALPSYVQITVKRGDYLARIAKENETRVEAIMNLNNLKSTQLKIGQILKIPAKQTENGSSTPKKSVAPKQYVVKPGDTLWAIAKNHSMQVSDLLKINHMSSDSANRLQPGDTLLVR